MNRFRQAHARSRCAGYYTSWYRSNGSPTFSITGIVHFKSKAFERTILKICYTVLDGNLKRGVEDLTFCTFMLWLVLLKIKLAFIARANFRACFEISSCSSRVKFTKWSYFVPTKNGIAV